MRKYILNPVFLGFVAVAILSASIWFVGDLLFEDPGWIRLSAIGVITFIWLAYSAWWLLRIRRANKKMMESMAAQADASGEAISAEEQALRTKFQEAMRDLGQLQFKGRGGAKYVYQLPWYVFVGPPGSGKTTALKALEKTGMQFLRASGDKIDIEGMGGTRNCNWVFTNEAVFIDTAGRYVQQGSDAKVDSAAWGNFLRMLRKARPLEPINGAIVAIGLGELAQASEAEIDAHAKALRARLDELADELGARPPVYVMFTKADLIAGFTEFFQPLRDKGQDQVWGVTFDAEDPKDPATSVKTALAAVPAEYDLLIERLGEIQFARLDDAQDPGMRARLFGFPAQFATMKPVVTRFLEQAFATGLDAKPAMLRGFYFTSATQEGQPVDRLLTRMARDFGLGRQMVGMFSGKPRAYFLGDLLREVIFPEQGMVRRQLRGRGAGRAAFKIAASLLLLAVPAALAFMLWSVAEHDRKEAAAFAAAMDAYRAEILAEGLGEVPRDAPVPDLVEGEAAPPPPVVAVPVADPNLERVLDPLLILQEARARLHSQEAAAPYWGMGIDEISTLRAQADAAYIQALDDLFRTRILFRLEQLMDARLDEPGLLYEDLKTYLMVGGRAKTHFDPVYVKDSLVEQWTTDLGVTSPVVPELVSHLDPMLAAMTEGRIGDRSLNDEGISRAQGAVSQISFAERAWAGLRRSPEARALDPWNPAVEGGNRTDNVFVRASGAPLSDPIPGLFTYEGFWGYMIGAATEAAGLAEDEAWLLAEDAARPTRSEAGQIQREILDLYYTEYVERWEGMLRDLRIVNFRDLDHAESVFRDISAAATVSPWVRILVSASRQTDLAATPAEDSPFLSEAAKMAMQGLMHKFQRGGRLIEGAAAQAAQNTPGRFVSDTFRELHDFVRDGGPSTEVDRVRKSLNGVYRRLGDMKQSAGKLTLLSSTPEGKDLLNDVRRAPDSVREPIVELFRQIETQGAAGLKAELNDIWAGSVLPECRGALEGRYPFGRGAAVGLIDLQAVLGPGGRLDSFFRDNLTRFVDQTRSPWQWTAEGRLLGFSVQPLQFFETVHKLRRAYFPNGLPAPQVNIGVLPKAFPVGSTAARVQIGGRLETFDAAQFQGRQLAWPGPQPANGALVAIVMGAGEGAEAEPGTEAVFSEAGEWGFFRMLDRAAAPPRLLGAGDRARVEFRIQGYPLLVELSLGSSVNPLSVADELKAFRCPGSLQ
ncbi:type VI secretion system membrane subunit TssM [Rhodovulum sp. DZ06]|uniref:type VI secretion system membrane subunit TssM n=1 Tax=Rhodovulum sp. DZ06 TaxID=3425126 RepID=UPI003D32F4BE